MLTSTLHSVAKQAAWLASDNATLYHLEKSHPGPLISLLRHAYALDALFNATRGDLQRDKRLAALGLNTT